MKSCVTLKLADVSGVGKCPARLDACVGLAALAIRLRPAGVY
jgi:hypothetical protein